MSAQVLLLPNAGQPPLYPGQRARRGKRPKHIASITELKKRRVEAEETGKKAQEEERLSVQLQDSLFVAYWQMKMKDRWKLIHAACLAANANGADWTYESKDGRRIAAEDFVEAGLLDGKEHELVILYRRLTPDDQKFMLGFAEGMLRNQ